MSLEKRSRTVKALPVNTLTAASMLRGQNVPKRLGSYVFASGRHDIQLTTVAAPMETLLRR